MSESALRKPNTLKGRGGSARVIPGFGLTLGITVTMLSVLIIIPLLSVLGYSVCLGPEGFWQVITRPNVVKAFVTHTCGLHKNLQVADNLRLSGKVGKAQRP